ncbi:hypothetical protein ACFWR9_11570 [Streptomyces sp. NPDC058534]|uniref:hypothetical protein n=1 Tax=Streptomyces sp. NPDC058534 TaxID=3346541 RepID=UPI0036543924
MAQRDFWITNTGDLATLQRRLRQAGDGTLKNNLNRRIRHAATPIHRDLQRTMRTLRVWGPGSRAGRASRPGRSGPPLRATIAAAIRLSVTTGSGAKLWVDKGQLPADWQTMPKNLDKGHWRHPTFGNKSRGGWADQYSEANWWWNTIRPHMPRLRRDVERILNDVERRLGG